MKTSVDLYGLYTKNQNNPNFLSKILETVKSEKVQIVCRNHHMMMEDYYFDYFKDFINYKDLFSLKAEEIHILIRIIVDSFRFTKNLSKARKRSIRMRIKNRIKKKYLIETLYGKKCIVCGEFNTKDHIRTFNFCHINPQTKTCQASILFDTYTCSEIVNILKKEKGVYICSNCHTVLDMDYYDIIEEIYDSEEIIKKVREDYHQVKNRIEKYSQVSLQDVKDPLTKKKIYAIRENVIVYFNAVYDLSQKGAIITNKAISKYTGVDYSGVKVFFFRRRDFLKRYIDFDIGKPTKYKLTQKGNNLVSLIKYFQSYFQSLELDECVDCKFRRENKCIATTSDEYSYIKSGTHLSFDLEE